MRTSTRCEIERIYESPTVSSSTEGHDIAVLRDGLAIAERLLDHPLVAPLLGESIFASNDDDAIRARVSHYYHPVGTCAMGNAGDEPCDGRARVRGLDNVYVADASLFAMIPRANTNMPAIMVGERVARWL